jgi:hypothetical protein
MTISLEGGRHVVVSNGWPGEIERLSDSCGRGDETNWRKKCQASALNLSETEIPRRDIPR